MRRVLDEAIFWFLLLLLLGFWFGLLQYMDEETLLSAIIRFIEMVCNQVQ